MSPETQMELEQLWLEVHNSRFYKQRKLFAGPDSFYAGIHFAELIIINRLSRTIDAESRGDESPTPE